MWLREHARPQCTLRASSGGASAVRDPGSGDGSPSATLLLGDLVRAQRPKHLPEFSSRDDVRAVLAGLEAVPRRMATRLYGSGLRLLECCRLRVKDIALAQNQILVRRGTGDKDRVTMLPLAAKPGLQAQLAFVRQHGRDAAAGAGWVELPYALAQKVPNAGPELAWQWCFPATRFYVGGERGLRSHAGLWNGN